MINKQKFIQTAIVWLASLLVCLSNIPTAMAAPVFDITACTNAGPALIGAAVNITVTVIDAASANPVTGASVLVAPDSGTSDSQITDSNGQAVATITFDQAGARQYDVTVSDGNTIESVGCAFEVLSPTNTPVPPTATPIPPTNTPTATNTDTPIPPTATHTASATHTLTPTKTATLTITPSATPTNTATATKTFTPVPSADNATATSFFSYFFKTKTPTPTRTNSPTAGPSPTNTPRGRVYPTMSPTVTPTRISGLGSIFSDPNTNDESGPDPSVMVTAIIMIVLVLLAALGLLIYLLQRRKYLRGGWAKKR